MPREVAGFVFRGMAKDGTTGMYVESGREHNDELAKRPAPRANQEQISATPEDKITPELLRDHYPRLQAGFDDERRTALAAQLQLPPSSFDAMPIGWMPDQRWWNRETRQYEGEPGCWTFPESDAQGRIIGIGLRWPTGLKGQLAGGHRGLSLTTDWRELSDPVILVEGPSDVLAGRYAGLNVIGRPSNSGGANLLMHACRHRQVIVLGENDRKPDGRWPGKDGAESVARKLETAWGRPVPIAYPPSGIKDLRAWIIGEATGAEASAVGTMILNALQPPALVLLVGPRDKRGRVSLKAFRWADGPDGTPIHSDCLNFDQESARNRFANALVKVERQTYSDEIAQRLVALNVQQNGKQDSEHMQSACVRRDAAGKEVAERSLPVVLLPGGPVSIRESAEQLGTLLVPLERYFARGQAIVRVSRDEAGQVILDNIKPAALASAFETVAELRALRKSGATPVQQPAVCTEQQAKLILQCEAFQQALPPLRLVSACPVLIERDRSLVQICGYDRDSGIMALATRAENVPLDQAIELIREILADFHFVTAADRARAIGAIVTPALIAGGLLGGRAPVDLGEADASQAGKGYRNKLTAAIYNQTVRAVTQRKGGVGSFEESFATVLIRGHNFISLDNVRGQVDSPAIESFLTEDTFLARAPNQAAVEIDPRRVNLQMTSNRADITVDLANRSNCVRILKPPRGYSFRKFPEGDVLDHVRAHQPRYLGAVFAVVRAWYEAGKPRTKETRHDFRTWAQTTDWIVQNIFHASPLLDGHADAQVRMATLGLNWLRDVALAVRNAGQTDVWLRAAQLAEVIAGSFVDLPSGGAALDDEVVRKKVHQAIGRRLGQCFRSEHILTIDGFEIERREHPDTEQRRNIREYCFRVRKPGPDECAYTLMPDRSGICASLPSGDADQTSPANADANFAPEALVCAYGAPVRAPNGKAVAPNAPISYDLPMKEDSPR